MAQGSKAKYTSKQKRQAQHIEESEKKSGKSAATAARIAWATVNKETGGAGKKVKHSKAQEVARSAARSRARNASGSQSHTRA